MARDLEFESWQYDQLLRDSGTTVIDTDETENDLLLVEYWALDKLKKLPDREVRRRSGIQNKLMILAHNSETADNVVAVFVYGGDIVHGLWNLYEGDPVVLDE